MTLDIKLIKAVIISLFISSFSLLLSFFGDYSGNAFNIIMAYAVGILFWAGLIVGYVLLLIINSHRKKQMNASKKNTSAVRKSRPGIIVFLSNKYAFIADLTMGVTFILTIVFLFIPLFNYGLAVVFGSVLLFSIHMHCLFNGMNFKYINTLNKRGE